MGALSGLEKSRGKAIGHVLMAAITLNANIKLIRLNSVLSASSKEGLPFTAGTRQFWPIW